MYIVPAVIYCRVSQCSSLPIHIIQGCATEDPFIQLYEYEDYIRSGIGSASYFIVKMKEVGIEKISNSCGMDASPVFEGIGIINDNLELLLGALR